MIFLENAKYRQSITRSCASIIHKEKLYGKTVMLLGATGLIGSYLVDCMTVLNLDYDAQIQIIACGRSLTRLQDRFSDDYSFLTFLELDVTESIPQVPADIVIHCAGASYPAAFSKTPVEIMTSNFLGIYRVLEYVKQRPNCRVVYVSSGEVYGNVDHTTTRACYPVSKIATETLCLSHVAEYKTDVVIARPCHTFGANVKVEDNHASSEFLRLASEGKDIILKSAGKPVRSYLYVGDTASAILTVLTCGQSAHIYDIAGDEAMSIREFAEMCAHNAGTFVRIQANTTEPETPISKQIMQYDKLQRLGWSPHWSLESGIAHTIQILQQTMK